MNRNDLAVLRHVLDPQLIKDGFIWRYQTYLHVNFDQYWFLAIWPKVFGIGLEFNMQFGLAFFHEYDDLVRSLKAIHSYQGQGMFHKFGFFNPHRDYTDVSPGSFLEVLELYQCRVRNIIHNIHTLYDACLFRREYVSLLGADQMDYHEGENMIRILLLNNMKSDALNVIPLMKNRIAFITNYYNDREQRFLTRWPRYYEEEKKELDLAREEQMKIMEKIDRLESIILNDQYEEQVIRETESLLKKNAEALKKSFSGKQIEQMTAGWNGLL